MYLFESCSSLDLCPGMGLLVHMVTLISVFKGTSTLFSIVTASTYIPVNSVGRSVFPHPFSGICYLQTLIIAILTGVTQYPLVVSICISFYW